MTALQLTLHQQPQEWKPALSLQRVVRQDVFRTPSGKKPQGEIKTSWKWCKKMSGQRTYAKFVWSEARSRIRPSSPLTRTQWKLLLLFPGKRMPQGPKWTGRQRQPRSSFPSNKASISPEVTERSHPAGFPAQHRPKQRMQGRSWGAGALHATNTHPLLWFYGSGTGLRQPKLLRTQGGKEITLLLSRQVGRCFLMPHGEKKKVMQSWLFH